MAISKQQKEELVLQYKKWVEESDGLILTHFHKLSVKDIGELRKGVRESGGEFHIIKNTLAKIAFKDSGREWQEGVFTGPTALGISYDNPTGLAKVLKDFSKEKGTIEIKSGYLAEKMVTVEEILALAELPSMDGMRAVLLSTIAAPATQLVRTLVEPSRQVAAVLKSYSEQESAA